MNKHLSSQPLNTLLSYIHTYIHTFLHICTNPSNLLSYQAMEHRGSGDGHHPVKLRQMAEAATNRVAKHLGLRTVAEDLKMAELKALGKEADEALANLSKKEDNEEGKKGGKDKNKKKKKEKKKKKDEVEEEVNIYIYIYIYSTAQFTHNMLLL